MLAVAGRKSKLVFILLHIQQEIKSRESSLQPSVHKNDLDKFITYDIQVYA